MFNAATMSREIDSNRLDHDFDLGCTRFEAFPRQNMRVEREKRHYRDGGGLGAVKLAPCPLPVSSIPRNYEQRVPFDGASSLAIHPACFSIRVTSPLIFSRPMLARFGPAPLRWLFRTRRCTASDSFGEKLMHRASPEWTRQSDYFVSILPISTQEIESDVASLLFHF